MKTTGLYFKYWLNQLWFLTVFIENSVVERDGARILVDKDSMQYLEGATIDFQSELIRSAFQILKNPKAESGCSCGASFSLKVWYQFNF